MLKALSITPVIAVLAVTSTLMSINFAHAEVRPMNAVYTQLLGGDGGSTERLRCNSHKKRIYGVKVHVKKTTIRRREVVSGIELLCRNPGSSGQWGSGKNTTSRTERGSSSSDVDEKKCEPGGYVTGLKVRTRNYGNNDVIARIAMECKEAENGKATLTPPTEFGAGAESADGWSAYTNDNTYKSCPDGGFANGIQYRSGKYLDSIGLICNPPNPTNEARERPILLVHGFGLSTIFSNSYDTFVDDVLEPINCDDYFEDMIPTLKYMKEKFGRTFKSIAFYETDFKCDEHLSVKFDGSNNLTEIAEGLAKHIEQNYAGREVDIIAHSMGGLVVRKAIADHGSRIKVRRVATLATPHKGATGILGAGTCVAISSVLAASENFITPVGSNQGSVSHNCVDMIEGSLFITNLEHNPQSQVPTRWFQGSTAWDWVVGPSTGHQMKRGDSGKPAVKTVAYNKWVRDNGDCKPLSTLLPYAPNKWAIAGEAHDLSEDFPKFLKNRIPTRTIVDHGDVKSTKDTFVTCASFPLRRHVTPLGLLAINHINK